MFLAIDLLLGGVMFICLWAPLGAITTIAGAALLISSAMHTKLRQRLRDTRGAICPDCGYPLAEIAAGRCPECGSAWTRESARRAWQRAFGGLWTEAFRDPPKAKRDR